MLESFILIPIEVLKIEETLAEAPSTEKLLIHKPIILTPLSSLAPVKRDCG